jgi:hypothetical protein
MSEALVGPRGKVMVDITESDNYFNAHTKMNQQGGCYFMLEVEEFETHFYVEDRFEADGCRILWEDE